MTTSKESYIKAEIVQPKRPAAQQFGDFVVNLILLAVRVLIVWWAIAAWFPELGITYWQAILPVYAVRALIAQRPAHVRLLT